MVSIVGNQFWWVRFIVLGPLAIQLHGYGWRPTQVAGFLGLAALYGAGLTRAWGATASPGTTASPNVARSSTATTSRILAVSLFVIPVTLLQMTSVGALGAAFVLLGLFTCFVSTCRFLVVGPLVLSVPTAGFVFGASVGVGYAAATTAATVLGWVAVAQLGFARSNDERPITDRSSFSGLPAPATTICATAIGVGAIAIAAVVTPRLPEPEPVGQGIASVAGWGITDEADLLKRPDRSEEIVAWVWTDTPNYWRIATLDQWDGRYWTSSVTELSVLRQRADGWLDLENNHQWSGGSVPTRVIQESVQFATAGATTTFGRPGTFSVRFNRDSATLMSDRSVNVADPFEAQEQFSFASQIPVLSPELLIEHEPADAQLGEAFLALNLEASALSPVLVELAAEITSNSYSSYEKVKALEAWFDANIRYDIDSPLPPKGTDPLEFLLLEDKTGYCEQMATSLVLMARSLGIPARMATGFVTNEYEDGKYVVRSQDAHAWAEIYFPDIGWVTFDPTDGTLPVSDEEADEAAGQTAATSVLQTTGALSITALLVAAAVLGVQQLRKPRLSWLESAIAQIYMLAGERFKMHERYTLADCLTGLAPPGTPLYDDAQWLEGLLAGAAYGNAEIDPAERARCKTIIKALRKSPRAKRSVSPSPNDDGKKSGKSDLSRIS